MPQFCGHNSNVWFWLCCFDVCVFSRHQWDVWLLFFHIYPHVHVYPFGWLLFFAKTAYFFRNFHLHILYCTNLFMALNIHTLTSRHSATNMPVKMHQWQQNHPLPIQCQWIYLEFYTIIIEPNYKLAHSKYQNTKWKWAKKSVAGLWSRETVW